MIHAQHSLEARKSIERQKRNSSISSILISFLVVALTFLIMGIFLINVHIKDVPTIVTYKSQKIEEKDIVTKKFNKVARNQSAPSSSMAKVIATMYDSPISIPVPDVEAVTPSADFGDGDNFGGGWGDGKFGIGGDTFKHIPHAMRKRCDPQERMIRLKESGGTEQGENAVVAALDYLQKTQNADGSWDKTHPVAMTALALLAYLGHCETPQSEKYGDTVMKAIVYLVNNGMQQDGKLTNKPDASIQWVYDHGIATYALAEAYTFCSKLKIPIPDLDKVVEKAGEIIMKGQAPSGGWNYRYAQSNDGDNSIGFWQIQALSACKHTGLWRESEFSKHVRLAMDFLEEVQGNNGAIGYRRDSAKSSSLTGGGVLALQMWGKGNSKEAKKGVDWIDKNSKFNWGTPDSNLYYHYYKIQAMLNHGGEEWDRYNNMIRDSLINAQQSDGSWNQKMHHGPINTHMATCLATLTLEAYYRFLPSSEK